jgi:hypothetical protein
VNLGRGLLLDAGPASLQRVRSFEIQVSVGPQALGPVWVLKSASFWRQPPLGDGAAAVDGKLQGEGLCFL